MYVFYIMDHAVKTKHCQCSACLLGVGPTYYMQTLGLHMLLVSHRIKQDAVGDGRLRPSAASPGELDETYVSR